ncbi:multidrug efflux system outer membrane protein [Sphaerotilus mobilis]|uniref:Multidrug efflux system outer membrane protein n=2 Tax=Sphaerotilus mobilis TaxID=47994 RepID=A0A4V2EVQ5_9BURK|nr:multidrug efflux system outer membrane protein [Sphaerotilus mobilis]
MTAHLRTRMTTKTTMREDSILLLRPLTLAVAVTLLTGCADLAPTYQRPAAPVPAQFVLPTAAAASDAAAAAAALPASAPAEPLAWGDWVRDTGLRRQVEAALAHNRDLRVAALNVERARAQLDVSLADRYPTIGAGVTANSSPNPATGNQAQSYTAGLQLASWEIDFLGRIRTLNDAARSQLLATEAGRRSAELSIVAAVTQTWLALLADRQAIDLAQRSLASREQTLALTQLQVKAGATSVLALQGNLNLVSQSRVALQQALRQRAQNLSTLSLLTGSQPAADAVPGLPPPPPAATAPNANTAAVDTTAAVLADDPLAGVLADVPAGLDASVLLRRPDVVQAERQLEAANANIGAARAAMFPRITLTGSAGQASSQFSGLFQGGNFAWTLGAQALMTIFDAGRNQANVNATTVGRDIAVAQYERAIQAAFKDTADALDGLSTWRAQREAQAEQSASAREIARLTDLRVRAGAASELDRLDAQRSLLQAEQALLQTRLAEQLNRVALWKALGG